MVCRYNTYTLKFIFKPFIATIKTKKNKKILLTDKGKKGLNIDFRAKVYFEVSYYFLHFSQEGAVLIYFIPIPCGAQLVQKCKYLRGPLFSSYAHPGDQCVQGKSL